MKKPAAIYIDSGAWIALAVRGDPYHDRARTGWEKLSASSSALFTSIPVIMETFTFLDRNAGRSVAIMWQTELKKIKKLQILECRKDHLERSWTWFQQRNLHKLSSVDAVSFELMRAHKIKSAFAFDTHFALAGFSLTE